MGEEMMQRWWRLFDGHAVVWASLTIFGLLIGSIMLWNYPRGSQRTSIVQDCSFQWQFPFWTCDGGGLASPVRSTKASESGLRSAPRAETNNEKTVAGPSALEEPNAKEQILFLWFDLSQADAIIVEKRARIIAACRSQDELGDGAVSKKIKAICDKYERGIEEGQ